jgi:predicted O-linked N-acetylglucosamine transferase (SPINDLY family)
MTLPRPTAFVLALTAGLLGSSVSAGNPASVALRAKAAVQIYNLDRDDAIVTFRQAIAADPQDAAAYRGLATALWLSITFRRGNMTVDDYLGRVSKPSVPQAPPPPEMVAAFRETLEKAVARAARAGHRKDADAHYQPGAAGWRVGRHRRWQRDGVRSGVEVYNEHEQVPRDPRRK